MNNYELSSELRNSPKYELKSSDYCILPTKNEFNREKDSLLDSGNSFLIKLHGSYNWKSSDGSRAMVIGRGKTEQIKNEPLLEYYFDIFRKVLSQNQRRLLVIGYGFGDEHINSVIADAVVNHSLKIYILSPESPKKFKEKLCEGCKTVETINIWNGISGYFQCVEDVLFMSRNDQAKKLFYEAYFGGEL
jgi:hypothetical protein